MVQIGAAKIDVQTTLPFPRMESRLRPQSRKNNLLEQIVVRRSASQTGQLQLDKGSKTLVDWTDPAGKGKGDQPHPNWKPSPKWAGKEREEKGLGFPRIRLVARCGMADQLGMPTQLNRVGR
ncbi:MULTISPECIES: hypothetical protein [Agrobacterium]|uniref:Uncharacterized protein n=1 Tax=Agrobacterium larrymoorei TaxID=160699 RepID=A0ABX8TCQ2_9HYPH|nr:hypothetical protein [Agrobacterium larrymoorei]QYA10803.1 hypothetical protein J5285_25960 [Agrobacterium larrymoorei]